MKQYEKMIGTLNTEQRQAVEAIDGPALVIAGPGTGKTQLLTVRAAHILQATDVGPENILCLTFTEAAAENMRTRLSDMIGQDAYKVTMSTFHAFGSDIIRRFPDYFAEFGELTPIDELSADQLLRQIVNALPYSNPLKFADFFLRDIKSTISDAKRAALTPDDLAKIAQQNDEFLQIVQPKISHLFDSMARVAAKDSVRFEQLAAWLLEQGAQKSPKHNQSKTITPLKNLMYDELKQALTSAQESGKTTPLTAWKNAWLTKNTSGGFEPAAQKPNQKLHALAGVYQTYVDELAKRGQYDYDDMILYAIAALERHPDLRFSLQEQYLYIMIDEFQDTNGAQLRLIELLTDNPVLEGRPNVLAVGDDDQAIYAFQGADHSHMLKFLQLYRDVTTVALTQNYRSHADVLQTAGNITAQITERLERHLPDINKQLVAANATLPKKAIIERREAVSDLAQCTFVADKIARLIEQGVPASEIAVLAPKHKYLEPLVPFLQQRDIPLRYEKSENVLDNQFIIQLERMSQLVLALEQSDNAQANTLWAEVLSYDFWQLPTSMLWELSWQANDERRAWTELVLAHDTIQPIALFFIRLSQINARETAETMLDHLIGKLPLDLNEPDYETFSSPFFDFYFQGYTNVKQAKINSGNSASYANANFTELLTNLTVLREQFRSHMSSLQTDNPPALTGFIDFINAHRAANIKIPNSNPHQSADNAVQLLTAFKAKGQEFQAVFLLALQEDVWGAKSRNGGSRLSLPPNLTHIRYAGMNDDERLRLLFVAITRAKTHLYLTSYQNTFAGKPTSRLSYLNETTDQEGQGISPLLPAKYQSILTTQNSAAPATSDIIAYWQQRHLDGTNQADLTELLRQRLKHFLLGPTHVSQFTDLEHQGPEYFFLNTLLRFPSAPAPQAAYGSAMHETLQWIHTFNKRENRLPIHDQVAKQLAKKLQTRGLSSQDTQQLLERGQQALQSYLEQRGHTIQPGNLHEVNFKNEGVFLDDTRLGGTIDKLIIDAAAKTITIVDFKTGTPHTRWQRHPKLHRYRHQLYLYKILVEQSHTFKDYRVIGAYLEFIEPDEQGNLHELHLDLNEQDQAHTFNLAKAIWQHIQSLNFPDINDYPATMKGVEQFEQDLLKTLL